MFYVINESNKASYTPPEWATTPVLAMVAAAAALSTKHGNLKLEGNPDGFTLTNPRGVSQSFYVDRV